MSSETSGGDSRIESSSRLSRVCGAQHAWPVFERRRVRGMTCNDDTIHKLCACDGSLCGIISSAPSAHVVRSEP